jgi:hypothetical protein
MGRFAEPQDDTVLLQIESEGIFFGAVEVPLTPCPQDPPLCAPRKKRRTLRQAGCFIYEELLGLIFRRNCRMTKAEYGTNGTIIRARYCDTPEQAQDALVKRIRHFHFLGGSVAMIGFVRGVCSDALHEIRQPRI